MNPMQPEAAPQTAGLDGLGKLIPQLMPFLAGIGFPTLMHNVEKMHKLMTGGGASAKKGQQPAGPAMGAVPGPTAMSPPVAPDAAGGMQMDPAKMNLILQIMKARGMA